MRQSRSGILRSFTLTEMVVVIAIIVMLAGLTLAVLPGVMGQSDTRRTTSTLELVSTALQEWENTAERTLRWGTNNTPNGATYDIQEDYGDGADSIETAKRQMNNLMAILERNADIREFLSGIDTDFLRRIDPDDPTSALRLIDPWDQPIVVIHPGRVADAFFNDTFEDADGTIRTQLENVLGICLNRRVCFVSAGPDGKFGNLHLDVDAASLSSAQQDEVNDAADNIYSYPIGRERP